MMARLVLCLVLLILAVYPGSGSNVDELHARLTKLQQTLDALMRQAILQQLFIEEKIRGDGDSGVYKAPLHDIGTRPYHTNSHSSKWNSGALYGNAMFPRSLNNPGFVAVLNGVQFRADAYRVDLKQAHRTSKAFKAVEFVEQPKIPPAVLAKTTVAEQTKEMIEWFRAFNNNDFRTRDFRPYFKPLLCYLEGFWESMKPSKGKYFHDEYVRSVDRDQFQAMNGARGRYWSYYGFNPTKNFPQNDNEPQFAKFQSRILCQPLKHYLLPNRMRPIDELSAVRAGLRYSYDQSKTHGATRFAVNPNDSSKWTDRSYRAGLLDKLMSEIPGLDNHGANLEDRAFDTPAYPYGKPTPTLLNAAYYHRYYMVKRKGAMGQLARHRSYSDSSVFMAMTAQPNVPGISVEDCQRINQKRVCKTYGQRWSYAIPLAVVYQTPLQAWNPLNINEKPFGDYSVTAKGRNGGFTTDKAFDGTSPFSCATIPPEFYSREIPWDKVKGVLDKTGKVVKARSCGIKTVIPFVKDIGTVRTVYPIYPTYVEGSSEYKEISALQDIVQESARRLNLIRGK